MRWPLFAVCAVGLVALGYVLRGGGETPKKTAVTEVRAVVKSFAGAGGPKACELLTDQALNDVYGGKRKCTERSRRFEPGAIRIVRSVVAEPTASVRATSLDGKTLFSVRLQKLPPGCSGGLPGNPWRISFVSSQPNV